MGAWPLVGSVYLTDACLVTLHRAPGLLLVIPQVLNLVRSSFRGWGKIQ